MSYPVRRGYGSSSGWNPFTELVHVRDRMERLAAEMFGGSHGREWGDAIVDEMADGWTVEVPLPGVAPEEVSVEVQGRELAIRAEIDKQDEERLRRWGSYSYRLVLPGAIDPDRVEATMDHGVLKVQLAKPPESQRQRIKVSGASERKMVEGSGSPSQEPTG